MDNVECDDEVERGRVAGERAAAARGDIELVVLDTLLTLERELASLLFEAEGEGDVTPDLFVEGEGEITREVTRD